MSGCTAADWSKPETASIDLIFPSAGIHVMDPDHPGDRPKVQATMENEVLRISDFPEIRFHSETVRLLSPGRLSVEGTLTIRGQARKVSIPLNFQPAAGGIRATGSYRLKQSDFGIEPVRVAAGTVRVKEEVDCDFELYLH